MIIAGSQHRRTSVWVRKGNRWTLQAVKCNIWWLLGVWKLKDSQEKWVSSHFVSFLAQQLLYTPPSPDSTLIRESNNKLFVLVTLRFDRLLHLLTLRGFSQPEENQIMTLKSYYPTDFSWIHSFRSLCFHERRRFFFILFGIKHEEILFFIVFCDDVGQETMKSGSEEKGVKRLNYLLKLTPQSEIELLVSEQSVLSSESYVAPAPARRYFFLLDFEGEANGWV